MHKALFLDRDGVVNVEINYLYKIENFEFIDGIFELCNHYQNMGYLCPHLPVLWQNKFRQFHPRQVLDLNQMGF